MLFVRLVCIANWSLARDGFKTRTVNNKPQFLRKCIKRIISQFWIHFNFIEKLISAEKVTAQASSIIKIQLSYLDLSFITVYNIQGVVV